MTSLSLFLKQLLGENWKRSMFCLNEFVVSPSTLKMGRTQHAQLGSTCRMRAKAFVGSAVTVLLFVGLFCFPFFRRKVPAYTAESMGFLWVA